MKKVQILALALALVALGSVSWAAKSFNSSRSMQKLPETAASNLNLSKSNINRLVYEKGLLSPTQATEILKELDKVGRGGKVEEAKVRQILQSRGIRADSVKEILYLPKTRTRELPTYVLLREPKNRSAAIALSDTIQVSNTSPTGITFQAPSQLQNVCSQANTQLLDRLSAVEACDKAEKRRTKEARNCRDALKNVPSTLQLDKSLERTSASECAATGPGNAAARVAAPSSGPVQRVACWGGSLGGCVWAICCSGGTCCGSDCAGPKGCRSE